MLLAAGLLLAATTVLLVASLSTSILFVVEGDLRAYWRTTYDILVRPPLSRSPVEEEYGLVEANYLAQLAGGISYEQFQAIAALPGVEVAAPVALLTYITEGLSPSDPLSMPTAPGLYLYEGILTTDGLQAEQEVVTHFRYYTYYYVGPNASIQVNDSRLVVNQPLVPIQNSVSLLLAAIDPNQEAKLVNLDKAVQEGTYLTGDERVYTDTFSSPLGTDIRVKDVPILINATSYVSLTLLHRLSQVTLPEDPPALDAIVSRGGVEYLSKLPSVPIAERLESTREAYPQLIDRFLHPRIVQHYSLHSSLSPVARGYQEVTPPFDYLGLVLEFEPPARPLDDSVANDTVFNLKATGVIDLARMPLPPDVNRVPLETYYPPVVWLRYDESGAAVTPRQMQPVLGPRSYVLSPPLLLTTLEAARSLTGDSCSRCISAIRVRVAGIEPLTPATQRKVETLAAEIASLTGLDVDIMVGSSPTPVLVHVPGIGYVEEQWIQKNVTYTYQQGLRTGHLLLLGTLFSIGGLFVLDLAWAEVAARRRVIALQKALGWRSTSIWFRLLAKLVLAGGLAGILAVPVAAGLIRVWGWQPLPLAWLAGVPLMVIALCALGGIYPAWLAARLPPVAGLQAGGVRAVGISKARRIVVHPSSALLLIAWRGLTRRWTRSALGGLTALLSATLLVLMLGVTVDRQGTMSGTLLGEFILVRIEAFHYALVGIGFTLAALSLTNSLLAGVLERQREIGVLKAIGWRTPTVTGMFLIEGVLLGAIGGCAGAALGLLILVGLSETFSQTLLWIWLVGVAVPIVVGAVAALYPARVAASVLPAEAVRHE